MSEKESKQWTIKSLEVSVINQIDQLKKDKNFSSSELMKNLLNNYILNENLLNQEEQQVFDNALSIENITTQELLKAAVMSYCNRIIKHNKSGKTEHIKTIEANNKLDDIVKSIILHNDNVESDKHKIYINQTALLKYVKDTYSKTNEQIKTFNVQVIKRYLAKNKDLLDQHHNKHNLTVTHNRDIANFRKTKQKEDSPSI